MAQGSKNQKTGAAKSRKGNEGKQGKQGRKQEEYYQEEIPAFLQAEVMIILSFAAAVLLFLSNFRLCGVVGNFLRGVQLGLFGVVGYIVPFILFIGTSFYIANRGNWKAVVKLSAVIGAALIICGIAQLISGIELAEGESFLTFYKVSGVNGKGGGLIGGMLSFGLRSIVGTIGTYLIFVVVLIICGVCITEKSVVNAVKNGGDRAYQYAREDAVRRREEREERLEEKRRLREDNVVRGVDFGSIRIQKDKPSAESGQLGIKPQFSENLSPEIGGQFPGDEQPGKAASFQEDAGSLGGASYPGGQFQEEARLGGFADKQAPSPADVFSGRIQLPPEYAEPVPFEEDRPEREAGGSLPKALGRETLGREALDKETLGREALGKRASDKPEAVTGKEDKPEDKILSFSKKTSKRREGPLYADREMLTLEEMSADFGLTGAGGSRQKDEADIWPGKREEAGGEEYGEAPFIEEISMGDVSDGGIPYQEPLDNRSLDGAHPKDPALEKGLDEPFFREPMDMAALKKELPQETDLDDDYFLDEDFGQEMGDFEEEDELFAPAQTPAKREDPPARDDARDHVFVPEGSKRVVTANGKIIETETELLHKRIEKKREEALEGTGQEAVRAAAKEPKDFMVKKPYVFPPTTLLKKGTRSGESFSEQEYKDTAIKLQQTLRNFGVGVTVTNISCGPSVTRYELHPEQGVKVSKIVGLADDIKLSLAAAEIRIEAPIPGKSAVGIEVPNKENSIVYLRELLESDGFVNSKSRLTFAVGKDIAGQPVTADIGKMPHLLIAGATGSGKSVCINTLIMSIIYKADPEDVKLIMVDPKVVELSVYNGIPHLMIPVVTDPKKASGALNWAVAEMGDRYKKFAEYNVRDLKGYNEKIKSIQGIPEEKRPHKLPQIVIIIDELADLMMVVPGEVEDAICRLAQLARAAGIHLVIATQRPSVNVITGLIKANVPSRIAFSVSSGVDSRTIIDMNGKGDMLFYPSGVPKPQRVQGAFVSDQEVSQVVEFLTQQGLTASYSRDMESRMLSAGTETPGGGDGSRDEYFAQAGRFIIEKDKASIGMLQRMFKIGFNRAARIMDQLADVGVVGEEEGTKPRKILMTMEEFDQFLGGGE